LAIHICLITWIVQSNADEWLNIFGFSGKGNGTIEIEVKDHVNSQKNGVLTIVNQKVVVSYDPKNIPEVSDVIVFSNENQNNTVKWEPFYDFNIGYHVYRSQMKGGVYYPVNSFPVNFLTATNGFIDYAVEPGNSYCYAIKAEGSQGVKSNLSPPVCFDNTASLNYDIAFESQPQSIMNIGGTVRYLMYIKLKESFKGWIDVSCSGLPSSMKYNFNLNNEDRGTSIHGINNLPAILELDITIGSATSTDNYLFDISFQNIWNNGSSPRRTYPLSILAVESNKGGIYLDMKSKECFQGEAIQVYGGIYPPLSDKQVNISVISENETSDIFNLKTHSMGMFEDSSIIQTLSTGIYEILAQWVDKNSNTYISESKSLIINKHKPILSLFRSKDSQPKIGEDFTISGTMTPAMPGQEIVLKVISPFNTLNDNSSSYTIYTDVAGKYQLTQPFFQQKGVYKVKSYWIGNDSSIGCESNMLVISVGSPGYAIILGAGKFDPHNLYSKATIKLTTQMYKDLKRIGFNDESIYFLINTDMIDIDDDEKIDEVVDENFPTVHNFLDVLDSNILLSLNSDTPLFMYLQGHGTRSGRLELMGNDDYLAPEILANELDELQSQTDCSIILLLEFCYSGAFIEKLSKTNRILFTSVDAEHAYPTDNDAINSFSRHFFSRIKKGDPLSKAFTYAKNNQLVNNYPTPLMDDNGDKVSNELDGLIASNTYLGNNLLWNQPKITAINEPVILNLNETNAQISIFLNEDEQFIKRVYAQIISPRDLLNMDKDIIVSFEHEEFVYNDSKQCYEAIITNLNQPGVYNIVAYAENINQEKSEPEYIFIRNANPRTNNDLNGDFLVNIDDIIYGLKKLCDISYNVTDNITLKNIIECMTFISNL